MIITEHQKLNSIGRLNPDERSEHYPDGLLLNEGASKFDQRYFFIWNQLNEDAPCYTASYIIGAQVVEGEELIIEPKMHDIDYMKMFSVCLAGNLSPEFFSRIYNIDLDAKPLKTKTKLSSTIF